MHNLKVIVDEISKMELLKTQEKLVKKLQKSDLVISKKTTYEPLLELLRSLFVTEFPEFNFSKKIAEFFFQNEIQDIKSGYSDFRSIAVMYHSYFSENNLKKDIFLSYIDGVDAVMLEKRKKRISEEVLLQQQLKVYEPIKNSHQWENIYHKGNIVLTAALQILLYLPSDNDQIERLNSIINEVVINSKKAILQLKSL